MSEQRIALKNPTGWFAAGREVSRAMALLSDGAFKVYMHVCLTADRSTGRMKIAHGDLAVALKKSRRSIVTYLEELRKQQICSIEAARNQHVAGHIEVCDLFWPYVKCRVDQKGGEALASYVEAIRQLLAARRCVKPVFNPADEKLATRLFGEHVELKQIDSCDSASVRATVRGAPEWNRCRTDFRLGVLQRGYSGGPSAPDVGRLLAARSLPGW